MTRREPHSEPTFVFGFGSLAADLAALPARTPSPHGFVADLLDHRRTWNVSMDNSLTVPGYKYYVDPETGERPHVSVAFVNLRRAAGHRVNGYCFPVTPSELAALDARERNYRRVDVSDLVEPLSGFRVVTYVGTDEARARYRRAARDGIAVVDSRYRRRLTRGFARLGEKEILRFIQSTDRPSCPSRELRRIEVPL